MPTRLPKDPGLPEHAKDKHHWLAWLLAIAVLFSTLIGGINDSFGVFDRIAGFFKGSATPSALTTGVDSSSPSQSSVGTPAPPTPNPSPGTATCRTTAGAAVECGNVDAWRVVDQASPCTSAGVITALGLDPSVNRLSIEAKQAAGHCLARPGGVSRKAGGTTAMLADPTAHYSTLAICYTASSAQVACSQPHLHETTGPEPDGASDPTTACQDSVNLYVGTSTPSLGQQLSATSGSLGGKVCIVTSSCTISQSVWHTSAEPACR